MSLSTYLLPSDPFSSAKNLTNEINEEEMHQLDSDIKQAEKDLQNLNKEELKKLDETAWTLSEMCNTEEWRPFEDIRIEFPVPMQANDMYQVPQAEYRVSYAESGHYQENEYAVSPAEHFPDDAQYPSPPVENANFRENKYSSTPPTEHREKKSKHISCPKCSKTFSRQYGLDSHMASHSEIRAFKCPCCNDTFKRSYDMKRHTKRCVTKQSGKTNIL
jgi:mRNA-degrading endonuclease RelE of RelBE toxin-antitoxin system/uncharacterized C2H2 Zn-finger protein